MAMLNGIACFLMFVPGAQAAPDAGVAFACDRARAVHASVPVLSADSESDGRGRETIAGLVRSNELDGHRRRDDRVPVAPIDPLDLLAPRRHQRLQRAGAESPVPLSSGLAGRFVMPGGPLDYAHAPAGSAADRDGRSRPGKWLLSVMRN